MAYKRKYRQYAREFINKKGHHSIGFAYICVGNSDEGTYDVQFTLGDCSRSINLDFPLGSSQEANNSVYKAKRLAQILQEFAAALEEEAAARKKKGREFY